MTKFLANARSRVSNKFAVIATMLIASALASAGANAAVDSAVTDLITGLGTDVAALFAAVVVLWAAIRGFMAAFKLGNKFISKAGA